MKVTVSDINKLFLGAAIVGVGTLVYLAQSRIQNFAERFFSSSAVSYKQRPRHIQHSINNYFENGLSINWQGYTHLGRKSDYRFPARGYFSSKESEQTPPKSALALVAKALESNETVHVLDLGTGAGQVLKEMKRTFPGRAFVQGVTASDFRGEGDSERLSDQEYLVGDVENLLEIPNLDREFDIIFSAYTFMHLPDPLGAICRAYELLKPNGQLVIDHFGIGGITKKDLEQSLIENGYECEMVGAANSGFVDMLIIKKNKPHLDLPFKYSAVVISGVDRPEISYAR